MKYFNFSLKKVRRNKLILIPFILIMLFVVFLYVGSHETAYHGMTDPKYSGSQEIEKLNKDIDRFKNDIKKFEPSSQQYKLISKNLQMAETRENHLRQRLDAFNNKDWIEYYKNDLALTTITLEIVAQNEKDYSEDFFETLKVDQTYARFMIEHKLPFDDRFAPSQGMSYMMQVVNYFMPIFLSIILIFIVSSMYCSSFIDNMDIHRLIPICRLKKQSTRVLVGAVSGVGAIVFIILLSVLCGSIGNSFGNIDSPIATYTMQGADKFIAFRSILPQLVLLVSLSILFIVNVTSVIAVFTKKNITCMISALAIIVGGLWVVTEIVPIYPISHMIPMTYLNSLQVISGELILKVQNTNVNFFNGVIVLSLSNVILFVMYDRITTLRSKEG